MNTKILLSITGLFFVITISYSQQYSTATGIGALYYQSSLSGANTATGYVSLAFLDKSWNNSAHGAVSLHYLTNSECNDAYGYNALQYTGSNSSNPYANRNVGVGSNALISNIDGYGNTAVGSDALYNANNYYNTGFGYRALFSTSTGSYNTGVGAFSGWRNATGNECTYIAGDNYSATNLDYVTCIGANSFATLANTVHTGDYYVSSIGGAVSWSTLSDKRMKKNVKQNVPGLSFINQLIPVSYNMDYSAIESILGPGGQIGFRGSEKEYIESIQQAKAKKEAIVYTGFLAQDVEASAKKIGYDFSGVSAPKNGKGLYGIRYEVFVVPLVKSIQELDNSNILLEKDIEVLEKQLKELESKIEIIKSNR
jgi:hypothetical protein